MSSTFRSRRSCLAVPGSDTRRIEKAQGLAADEVFLDLEDAVSPLAKADARRHVVTGLVEGDWSGKVLAVRVNDVSTQWAYRGVVEVGRGDDRRGFAEDGRGGRRQGPGRGDAAYLRFRPA